MLKAQPFRSRFRTLLALVAVLLLLVPVNADNAIQSVIPDRSYATASGISKASGRPLIVFAMVDSCVRCQKLKQDLSDDDDLQLILSQYVAATTRFGSDEFQEISIDMAKAGGEMPESYSSPSVFVMAADGRPIFAGPNRKGLAADDELKAILISGIKQNGGLRASQSVQSQKEPTAGDIVKIRNLVERNRTALAAKAIAPFLSSDDANDQLAELEQLTGLQLKKNQQKREFDQLTARFMDRANRNIEAAVRLAGSGKVVPAAVKLAESDLALRDIALLREPIDLAWKQIEVKAKIAELRQQALQIGAARIAESSNDVEEALENYHQVIKDYPDSPLAKLCQTRINQLSRPAGEHRIWKSKSGDHTINAALISFDGTNVKLKTNKGRSVKVPVESLSSDDREYLEQNHQPKSN